MGRVAVELGERTFAVHVERGAAARAAEYLPESGRYTRVLVVTDDNVAPLYADAVARSFDRAGLPVTIAVVPPGEEHKTLATVERLYHDMAQARLDRKSLVAALGGGVVGDVAGFAAATYMRGVAVMHIPTTIVAQVDSSIGGKTGVDLPEGKNLVGAFHQPVAVVADVDTLFTLPPREVRAGLAEVVKHGVILDAAYFESLERLGARLAGMTPDEAEAVILRSIEIKAGVVAEDERESGLRAILNFGHTVGHALETTTGYSAYLHGEAVAVGMVAAARIAAEMGLCGGEIASRIAALLAQIGLPTDGGGASAQEVTAALALDKKALAGRPRFVLPREIGRVEMIDAVPASALQAALAKTGFAA